MGSLVSKVGQGLGILADPNTGQAQMQQAQQAQMEALNRLDALGVPTVAEQEVQLVDPDLILSSPEERIARSAMEDIALDPMLRAQQAETLAQVSDLAEQGYSEQDRAMMRAMQREVGADEQARQAAILQSMAQRGALDSGAQLAAQLSSSQAATNRAAEAADRLAVQAAQARLSALGQKAQMAGQLRSQDYGEQTDRARAQDAIRQFNAGVAARDTAARQQQAANIANRKNLQEQTNKGLIQQNFQNQLAKAGGAAQQLGNVAAQAQNNAQMRAQAAQQQAAGIRDIGMGGAKMLMGGFADGGVQNSGNSDFIGHPRSDLKYFKDKPHNEAELKTGAEGAYYSGDTIVNHPYSDLSYFKDKPQNSIEESVSAAGGYFMDGGFKGTQESNLDYYKDLPQNSIEESVSARGGYFNDGGMNYEAGGTGTIIESGMESYAGDNLPDRINDGEMVLNLDQQENLNGMLQELGNLRADQMVNNGEAMINDQQQQALFDTIKGKRPVEAMPDDEVVQSQGMKKLLRMLGRD